MMCECWDPSFSILLIMEESGASQSVCAVAAHASAKASANKVASFAGIRMFRSLISRRFYSKMLQICCFDAKWSSTSATTHVIVKDLGICAEGFRTMKPKAVVPLEGLRHL